MLRDINHKTMGGGDQGWLKSLFHFSFADYHNPNNVKFGVFRVLNDDLVQAGYGFDMHFHQLEAINPFAFKNSEKFFNEAIVITIPVP